MFAEHGYAAASMTEIAARAGVVASVIYDHFASKRELYIDLLELHGRSLIERSVIEIPDAPPEQRTRLGVEAFYEFVEEDPFVWRFLFQDPPTDPEAAAAHSRIRDEATEAIAVQIAAIAPQVPAPPGMRRDLAARMFAEAARAATDGLAGWWYDNRDVPREQVVTVATALLWGGFQGLIAGAPGGGSAAGGA